MYELPNANLQNFKRSISAMLQDGLFQASVLLLIILVAVGAAAGKISVASMAQLFGRQTEALLFTQNNDEYVSRVDYEQAIIDSVKKASPSVVSIVISKNLPVYEQQFINPFGFGAPFDVQVPQYIQRGTAYQQVGAGSGFIVSEDGLVLTNRHVVSDKDADYTVITNDGAKYAAKVQALDPVQDLAIIKIQGGGTFPAIVLGNSDGVQIGQGVIAIGNALGEFSNTVSVGVVSGLGRTVNASNQTGSFSETLENVIQTDAAINQGNSGGPLINLRGEVIGVNTAMAQGAQSIGFVIPINIAKRDLNQLLTVNKITYAFLGVRYILVDEEVREKYGLSVDYGALVLAGENGQPATTPGSAAQKAGLKEGDIILEFNSKRVDRANSLSKMIASFNPGDTVMLKILREGQEVALQATLGERN